MSDLERKMLRLAADLLDLAADQFSNHGCNDYPWPAYLTAEDRLAITRMMQADNTRTTLAALTADQTEHAKDMAETTGCDWWLMRFLAKRLRSEGLS